VLTLSLASFCVVAWAFYAAGVSGLDPDQRAISNFFFALLAGGAGFFFSGITLNMTGQIWPNMKFTIRAISGIALFLVILFHPLFISQGSGRGQTSLDPTRMGGGIRITNPSSGTSVGPMIEVHGHTDYSLWHHYVVVEGLKGGGDIVQDGEVK